MIAGCSSTTKAPTLERNSRRFGTTGDGVDFSLLLDELEDERQQRITIDVAYSPPTKRRVRGFD
jgi:bifunctional enzyme CysN/CysC